MFSRALHAATLVLLLALACSCSGPTAPSSDIYSLQPQSATQPSPPTGGATSIEGEYSLTITTSANCTALPLEVRQRTYAATIREPQKGHVTVTLSGADFALADPPYYKAGFEGERNDGWLHFLIDNGYGSEYSFVERIDGKYLFFEGAAVATVGDAGIEGPFNARIRYFYPYPGGGQVGDCDAPDHRMVFTRQGQR